MPEHTREGERVQHEFLRSSEGNVEGSFNSRIARAGSSSIAVLLVDTSHFQAFGEAGERALSLAKERIGSALRGNDSVHSLEGDRFAILLEDVQSDQHARAVADRIFALLKQPYMMRGKIVNAPARMGIACASPDVQDAHLLLRRAGFALQIAQSCDAANVQFFDPASEARMAARHALCLDLRKALFLRQLEVHYQPQVQIGNQKLIGFEALLRWRHPELGWISPVNFIPLAEETGSIVAIGDWVLRTVCEQAARLPDHLTMAVNVSPIQFRSETFSMSVGRALAMAGISPRKLELEITEGVLVQNEQAVAATLNKLRHQGVRIAMDDFGTGYSSLGQLVKLPFDTIKIDRSLVGGSSRQRAVVRAIAMLGEGLGMSVLAEGIETAEQLARVREDGCVATQGYLFGSALPASELDAVVARLSQGSYSSTHLEEVAV